MLKYSPPLSQYLGDAPLAEVAAWSLCRSLNCSSSIFYLP